MITGWYLKCLGLNFAIAKHDANDQLHQCLDLLKESNQDGFDGNDETAVAN